MYAPADDAVEGAELGVLDHVDDRGVVAGAHEVVHRHDLVPALVRQARVLLEQLLDSAAVQDLLHKHPIVVRWWCVARGVSID